MTNTMLAILVGVVMIGIASSASVVKVQRRAFEKETEQALRQLFSRRDNGRHLRRSGLIRSEEEVDTTGWIHIFDQCFLPTEFVETIPCTDISYTISFDKDNAQKLQDYFDSLHLEEVYAALFGRPNPKAGQTTLWPGCDINTDVYKILQPYFDAYDTSDEEICGGGDNTGYSDDSSSSNTKENDTDEDDTKEDDTKTDNTNENATESDETEEDNTKEKGTTKADTKEDDTEKTNTKQNDTEEDETKKEDASKDDTEEENTKEKGTTKDDTKEDDTEKNNTKQNDTEEDDTEEEGTTKDGTKEDDTKEKNAAKNGIKDDDTEEDDTEEDDTDEDDTDEDDTEEDDTKKDNTKVFEENNAKKVDKRINYRRSKMVNILKRALKALADKRRK